ncbi:ABC transporter permease [Chondrinema litorale]|uniref:ABC transporter permease n=1 Tax=Chondrinema litorale TaxID=2994555 RepID=UPI0025434A2F|nr:ABC transporter permease [Chondrinema litorale]UZR93795.1 ABC transporter permease [Chondrinema litorale]
MSNKISLIISREYFTRVRKKSFIIMSILGPLLLATIYIVPIWLTQTGTEDKIIAIKDESGLFAGKFKDDDKTFFIDIDEKNCDDAKISFLMNDSLSALLCIPAINIDNPQGIRLYSRQGEGVSAVLKSMITSIIQKEIEKLRWQKIGVNQKVINRVNANVSVDLLNISDDGEQDMSVVASTIIGMLGGLLVYFFTFLYGAQVMRGVIEEKTTRIVEVIISSVKPFQLMMGKIIGIAAVGFTQLMIWVLLGIIVISVSSLVLGIDYSEINGTANSGMVQQAGSEVVDQAKEMPQNEMLKAISTINFPLILGAFVFYFLFGYLLYAALFGAIGAAVDSETDTQQFMLPVTVPLIISIAVSGIIVSEPNGAIAMWLSFIPLTSPVIMMIRLPFIGVNWQLFVSMGILVLGFIIATWLAGRIYRVGILMYGKKASFKELIRWMFYQ